MPVVRIGLLIIDNVTLEAVTSLRERLEAMGARVTVIVPTGGPLLPISGRYFPGAGGHCDRQSISQISAGEYHLVLIPDGVSDEQLLRFPDIQRLGRSQAPDEQVEQTPLVSFSYVEHLIDNGTSLDKLAKLAVATLSGNTKA